MIKEPLISQEVDTKKMAERALASDVESVVQDYPESKKFEFSEEAACLIGDLQFLKKNAFVQEDRENYQKRCFETVKDLAKFFDSAGSREYREVSALYNEYRNDLKTLVVRKENPEKVIRLAAGEEQEIFFDPKVVRDRGDKYANCAIWPYGHSQVAGIANAFLEGRHMAGPIALVLALRPNEDHLQIEIPEEAMAEIGDIKREAVRIMSGVMKPEDIEFVIVRVQRNFYPQELLTESEKKSSEPQIFRAYSFRK